MAEAEIDALLQKKYADLEADFAALVGPALLQPAQVEVIKTAFDREGQKEIAKVLEARGGANPDAVAAARLRSNTQLESFLKQYDAPSQPSGQVLSDAQLNDMLKDIDAGQTEARKRAESRIQEEYRRRSLQAAKDAPAPASAVSISANKSAVPGGFRPGALNVSSDNNERGRSMGTMISPRKRNSTETDNAKRLSLFEAQLMEETERARAMMAEQQAKEREAKARAEAQKQEEVVSPRPGPTVRQELPPQNGNLRSTERSPRRSGGFVAAPAAEARRQGTGPSVAAAPAPAANPPRGTSGYRPPSISGYAGAVRASSPMRNSWEGKKDTPAMQKAPAPSSFDEPLLIDSYHQLPDDVPKEKGRTCSNCTLV